jgi:hypothetical protein
MFIYLYGFRSGMGAPYFYLARVTPHLSQALHPHPCTYPYFSGTLKEAHPASYRCWRMQSNRISTAIMSMAIILSYEYISRSSCSYRHNSATQTHAYIHLPLFDTCARVSIAGRDRTWQRFLQKTGKSCWIITAYREKPNQSLEY